MALKRQFLAALGIEAEKIDEIINAHSETVEALKEERDSFREKAEKYDKAQKDLTAANKKIEELSKDDAYKVKYDALKEEYTNFKHEIETERINGSKRSAYKALLKEIGIADKRIDAVAKLAELDKITLDADGNIEGADDLKKALAAEWDDLIVREDTQGANTATPPDNGGNKPKTKDEIMQIKDTTERQKAWGELIRQGGI